MKAVFPLHSIGKFTHSITDSGVYVNEISDHLKFQGLSSLHKHDFYCVIFCTEGSGKHDIDFKSYDITPGSVHFMYPGQTHRITESSRNTQGYILFHTRDYYEVAFNNRNVKDYPFYYCSYNNPVLRIKPHEVQQVEYHFAELLEEYHGDEQGKYQKICALMDLIYINLSRLYQQQYAPHYIAPSTPRRIRQFEGLVEKNFSRLKSPADYARLMKTTTKQLNRICRDSLGKTTSELIMDRVMLEAKRELLHNEKSVADIAAELGYFDAGYFSRLFRKKTSLTPSGFLKKYSASSSLLATSR